MRGRTKYVPAEVIIELDCIKEEQGFLDDRSAMGKMVEYTRVGRELERLMFPVWGKKLKGGRRRRGFL